MPVLCVYEPHAENGKMQVKAKVILTHSVSKLRGKDLLEVTHTYHSKTVSFFLWKIGGKVGWQRKLPFFFSFPPSKKFFPHTLYFMPLFFPELILKAYHKYFTTTKTRISTSNTKTFLEEVIYYLNPSKFIFIQSFHLFSLLKLQSTKGTSTLFAIAKLRFTA